jgi:hypothetical protein
MMRAQLLAGFAIIVICPGYSGVNCRLQANALIEQGFEPTSEQLVL